MAVSLPRHAEIVQMELARLNRESVAPFNRGDVSACADCYAEDATMLLPDQPPIRGRAAIRHVLERLSTLGVTLMPVKPSAILSSGELGVCAGTYEFRVATKDVESVVEAGKFVTVFRREQGGSWRAVIDSFFADTDAKVGLERLRAVQPVGDRDTAKHDDRAREEVCAIYNKGARYYDSMVWLYYLAGMRIGLWRRKVIEELSLHAGATVVEIGCGTSLNFSLVEEFIGSEGKIIGVDISEAMLERARMRVQKAGWRNVELIRCAATDYQFPRDIGGVFAAGVLNYEPAYDQVIERGAKALAHGRRWVVLDYKMPKNWLRHLAPLFTFLGSGFGVSRALMGRCPWRSVERHLRNTRIQELYGGFVYIISGEAP